MFFELLENTRICVLMGLVNLKINEKNVFIGTRESLSIQLLVVNYRYTNTHICVFPLRYNVTYRTSIKII